MAVITRANYKTYAGISGTDYDAQLDIIIAGVEDYARRMLGRSMSDGLESATRTEDYEPTNAGTLQLREHPVTSITSISPIDAANEVGTAFDSSTYHADLRTGLVYLNGADTGRGFSDDEYGLRSGWGWQPSFGRVRVVYVSAAAESDLVLALYRLVDAGMAAVKSDPTEQSQSLGNWSITRRAAAEAIRAHHEILKPFTNGAAGVA